jgi:hypothetical protein
MIKPKYPVKFGVFIQTNLKEYEHFVGHIVDVAGPADSPEWVSYELPLNLMINNNIEGRMVQCQASDHFDCKGLTFSSECSKTNLQGDLAHHIKRIDVVHNPEFYSLK